MKKTLKATALAVALCASGGASAAGVIKIDANANGTTDFVVDTVGFRAGYSLAWDLMAFGNVAGGGEWLAQAHVPLDSNPAFPNAMLTYQFRFTDVASTTNGTDNRIIGAQNKTGSFKLFFDANANDGTLGVDKLASTSGDGIGYGDLNGATKALGQIELLSGTITMLNAIALTQDAVDKTNYWLAPNDPTKFVATWNWQGTGNYTVNVTSQTAAVTNDMVGGLINIFLLAQGNTAPTLTNNEPSNIVGQAVTSTDYGAAEMLTVDNTTTPGVPGSTSNVTVPLNDPFCNSAPLSGIVCSASFQTSGTMDFQGPLPEPGSLALAGISLGLVGMLAGRRRRRPA